MPSSLLLPLALLLSLQASPSASLQCYECSDFRGDNTGACPAATAADFGTRAEACIVYRQEKLVQFQL